jgi:transcriptional regulator with XRE-family HTH domain
MGNFSRARRAGAAAIAGRRRAQTVATRLGVALHDARLATGITQAQAGERCGLSQTRYGELERGLGSGASLETWAVAAATVGETLAAFLERAPGAAPPRDLEHLRRQNAVVEKAAGGGWTALPELAIDPGERRSRSIDVALVRRATREAIAVEIWDWLDDVGAAWRGLDAKVSSLQRRLGDGLGGNGSVADGLGGGLDGNTSRADGLGEGLGGNTSWRVGGLFVLRRTRRNRALLGDLASLFAARFPGRSAAWLLALEQRSQPIPAGVGFLWSTADGRLIDARLRSGAKRQA